MHVGKSCAVRLGVHSFESTSVTYRITMSTKGVEVTPWPSVVLAPQEEWAQLVPIISGNLKNVYVEARLYRLDKPHDVYREVHLTLYGCPISQVTPNHYPGLARAYKGNIHDNPTKVTTNQSYSHVILIKLGKGKTTYA